jgi:phage N-6-adenine-methyltransferase
MAIGVHDEYGTPKDLYEERCDMYDIHPTLDVCASKTNHVCSKYYTKEDDFFTKVIDEDSYMNAPYSKQLECMDKMYQSHLDNNINAMILAFAKVDTKWWHEYVEDKAEVHFKRGRINFLDDSGNPKRIWSEKDKKWKKGVAPYPSAFIIYRSRK